MAGVSLEHNASSVSAPGSPYPCWGCLRALSARGPVGCCRCLVALELLVNLGAHAGQHDQAPDGNQEGERTDRRDGVAHVAALVPALFERRAVDDGREEGAAGRTSGVNTKLVQATGGVRQDPAPTRVGPPAGVPVLPGCPWSGTLTDSYRKSSMTFQAPIRTTSAAPCHRWAWRLGGELNHVAGFRGSRCISNQTRSISSMLGSWSEPLIFSISSFRNTPRPGVLNADQRALEVGAASPAVEVR